MRIRNKRTGVEGDYPEKQAKWLIATGRCEKVQKIAPAKKAPDNTTKRATYQTKDMQADVAISKKAKSTK